MVSVTTVLTRAQGAEDGGQVSTEPDSGFDILHLLFSLTPEPLYQFVSEPLEV